ncbi:unnamed protein product [Chrysoparadoxa australica]
MTDQGCGSFLDLRVNDQVVADDVCLINEGCDIGEYLKGGTGPERMLVVTSEEKTLLQLVQQAKSFSCSLGPAMKKVLIPLLSTLPDVEPEDRPVLYACENDHNAARNIGKRLQDKVRTSPCMVDRICTGRDIYEEYINVDSEPEFPGCIIMLDPPQPHDLVPFGGPITIIPKTKEEAEYFYVRKVSIVNGMHTTLAFLTLCECSSNAAAEAGESKGAPCADLSLITDSTASPEIKAEIWAWVICRCAMLLEKFGNNLLMEAHGFSTEEEVFDELFSYARTTLERFNRMSDTTSRVLGGGVGNRWSTRLRPVAQFMQENDFEGTAPGRLLQKAGVTEEFARQATSRLVADSLGHCSKEVQATVEGLVEFYKESNRLPFGEREEREEKVLEDAVEVGASI